MVHGAVPEDVKEDLGRIADHARVCKEYGVVSKGNVLLLENT